MYVNKDAYFSLKQYCDSKNVTLVAVSKTKPIAAMQELYDLGHRHFGENYVQELIEKEAALPKDIFWHFIGHLQSNKVKYILPITHLIHGVDSKKLLDVINKEANKKQIKANVLLQMHIAQEETKYGMDATEMQAVMATAPQLNNVVIKGLMGMASFVDDKKQINNEFTSIAKSFNLYKSNTFNSLSIGMSGDYEIAVEQGSSMIRVGSLIFGARTYNK